MRILLQFLLLLLCVPKMEVMRTHPKYLDGGPTDTFLFEGTGHASTNPAESQTPKDPLKADCAFPIAFGEACHYGRGMKVGGSIDIGLVFSLGRRCRDNLKNKINDVSMYLKFHMPYSSV